MLVDYKNINLSDSGIPYCTRVPNTTICFVVSLVQPCQNIKQRSSRSNNLKDRDVKRHTPVVTSFKDRKKSLCLNLIKKIVI